MFENRTFQRLERVPRFYWRVDHSEIWIEGPALLIVERDPNVKYHLAINFRVTATEKYKATIRSVYFCLDSFAFKNPSMRKIYTNFEQSKHSKSEKFHSSCRVCADFENCHGWCP